MPTLLRTKHKTKQNKSQSKPKTFGCLHRYAWEILRPQTIACGVRGSRAWEILRPQTPISTCPSNINIWMAKQNKHRRLQPDQTFAHCSTANKTGCSMGSKLGRMSQIWHLSLIASRPYNRRLLKYPASCLAKQIARIQHILSGPKHSGVNQHHPQEGDTVTLAKENWQAVARSAKGP